MKRIMFAPVIARYRLTARAVLAAAFTVTVFTVTAFAAPAAAGDWRHAAGYALTAKHMNIKVAWPWLAEMEVDSAPHTIRAADGRALMYRPTVVASAYDASARYDLSRFYRPHNPRVRFKLRYAGRARGEVISVGIDTGYAADKITVKPALLIGYARAFEVRKNFYLTAGISGVIGGRVTERACFDSYDRAYYCPTLTAWRDHRPRQHRNELRGGLMLTYMPGRR